MKEIKLTQGMVALVDDEDYQYLSQFDWYACKCDNKYYARRSARVDGKDIKIYMHREILGLERGQRIFVDHKDRDGLNNQRSNIRLATCSQNNANKDITLGVSGYRGVSWFKPTRKWVARIKNGGKFISLGYFDKPEMAAAAYNTAALKFYGEFASLNKLAA
jgi:hypothetical protein